MLVLPFVSLCREKEKHIKKLLKPLHRRETILISSMATGIFSGSILLIVSFCRYSVP